MIDFTGGVVNVVYPIPLAVALEVSGSNLSPLSFTQVNKFVPLKVKVTPVSPIFLSWSDGILYPKVISFNLTKVLRMYYGSYHLLHTEV